MNWSRYRIIPVALLLAGITGAPQMQAETASATATVQQQVDRLAEMVSRQQAVLESSQRQIELLRQQIGELQGRLAVQPGETGQTTAARLNASVDSLRERQDLQQSEIATHEQSKVESASKFPVKLTGLILMNTFANTAAVDVPPAPTLATGSGGTTGLSLRQTVLGLDASGPHLLGATSAADVRVDFFGGSQGGYSADGGLVRLRTAHAELNWDQTRAFVQVDRPILNPNVPSSLTAVAQPALAWSGNLANWVPQVGADRSVPLNRSSRLSLQAAIADIPDPPTPGAATTAVAGLGEQSRWPASEARIGYARDSDSAGFRLGAGGYFAPHSLPGYLHFDAWAATADYRVPLFARLEASGSVYRGSALGGLGAGAYKDYAYRITDDELYYRPLDDVGGWTQLKERAGERLEFNTAVGIDNVFAHELRPYLSGTPNTYQSLTRNFTWFANVIYSPTAYTLFSFEYRRIESSYAYGSNSTADVYGVAAGYRF